MDKPSWLRSSGFSLTLSPRTGLILLEGILVVGLGVSLAGLTWDLAPPPGREVAPDIGRNPASEGSRGGRDRGAARGEVRILPAVKGLFGERPASQEDGTRKAEEPVRETRLDLSLKGILVKGDGPSLAIIAESGSEQKVYRTGDRVPGGAKILRIEPRRVILRHNGVTEALKLEVQELKGGDIRSAGGGGAAGGIQRVDDHHRQVDSNLVQKKLQDLPSLLRQAKAVPHRKNGQNAGFRIVNIQSGSVYEDLGLKEGDVIKGVNGRSIRSPSQAMEAYRELRSSQRFEVQVVRDGSPVTLTYSVQ